LGWILAIRIHVTVLLAGVTGLVKLPAALLALPRLTTLLASLTVLAALLLFALSSAMLSLRFRRVLARPVGTIRMHLSDNLVAKSQREGWDKYFVG
jgi:hypothetical protein